MTKWAVENVHPSAIEIRLEGEDVMDVLLAIAQHSYETAKPRQIYPWSQERVKEQARKQNHLHPVENSPDFRKYIQPNIYRKPQLAMDYINNRDCRTLVSVTKEGTLYFSAWAFEQREVDREEFHKGYRAVSATEFLDEVILKMNGEVKSDPIQETLPSKSVTCFPNMKGADIHVLRPRVGNKK